jgi:competence protein ComEA
MRVADGQALGALALLMISLGVYGTLLLIDRFPLRVQAGSWGNQGPGTTAVEVVGDPAREGIYFLPGETTVGRLRAAVIAPGAGEDGGLGDDPVSGGAVLDISGKGMVKTGEMTAARKLALGLRIDINRASKEELVLVPGIGEKTAERIIRLRKQRGAFRDLSELTSIPGIKEKRLNHLRKYLATGR